MILVSISLCFLGQRIQRNYFLSCETNSPLASYIVNPIFANKDVRKSATVNIFTSPPSWPWGLNLPFVGQRMQFTLLSQGSVATEFRCGGRFYFTIFRSLSTNPKVKELLKSVHICQSYRKNKSGTFFNGPRCTEWSKKSDNPVLILR